MNEVRLLERIETNPRVMIGKPVIRGTRLTVESILKRLAYGETPEAILAEYDGLVREDIQACLLFATKSLESASFLPLMPEAA